MSSVDGEEVQENKTKTVEHKLVSLATVRRSFVDSCNLTNEANKGPSKRRLIVADTLLPTQIFTRLPARATFVADTHFVSGT